MKLKYYLRGLGIGIIVTTIILMIAYSGNKTEPTDAEIIARAEKLGMVMKEDPLFSNKDSDKELVNTEVAEMTEVLEDTQTTEDTETAEDTESLEGTEIVEDTGSLEGTEIVEDTESSEGRETVESTETLENSEILENTEVLDNSEVSENTEADSEQVSEGEKYHLVIPPGGIPRLICNELEENGVVESASELRQYLVDVGYITSIVVGSYDIPYNSTNEEVYQILKAGPISR